MTQYLLDTNVLSELRRPHPHTAVISWFTGVRGADLFISILTIGEIRQGIERLRGRDPRQARALDDWVTVLLEKYASQLVPVDLAVAEAWGRLNAIRPLPAVDGLLAATARTHDLTVATRNTADFQGLDIPLVNPFAD